MGRRGQNSVFTVRITAGLLACATSVLDAGEASAASAATWDKVSACESGGNRSINTGNDLDGVLCSSSRAVGGAGHPTAAARRHRAVPSTGPLEGTATRLYPHPGPPSPHDSSVGGPLLWPTGEPWPHGGGPYVWTKSTGLTRCTEPAVSEGDPG
ncbi:transglycosylase family protein [Streptomyces sp. CBMA156]|uniref:transglycosylase family protein n=1 Tax=Streptomyces sp. CBMA156 TaxID=1930280 RepID=UPI0039836AC4